MIFDDAQSLKLLGAFAPSLQEMQTAFHSSAKIQSRKESQTCWQALCQASHRASFRAAQVDSHLEAVPLDGRRVYMTSIWLQYPPKLNHKHPETHIENLCILQNHKQFKLFKHAPIPPSGQAPCQHLLHMETPWGRSVAQLPCLQWPWPWLPVPSQTSCFPWPGRRRPPHALPSVEPWRPSDLDCLRLAEVNGHPDSPSASWPTSAWSAHGDSLPWITMHPGSPSEPAPFQSWNSGETATLAPSNWVILAMFNHKMMR